MKKKRLNYFDEFLKEVDYSIECSNLLLKNLKQFDKKNMQENIEEMHRLEHEADKSKHEMMDFLLKDFLPPIEREDIINISHRIDNVTDFTEEILINLDIFNVENIEEDAVRCAEFLVKCCDNLKILLGEFENFKKSKNIRNEIIEINRLEGEGDKLYAECMKKLYSEKRNAIDIIIWTKIYNCFEKCFDACESIADYVETVIMKNS